MYKRNKKIYQMSMNKKKYNLCGRTNLFIKKKSKKICRNRKKRYLCICYPENNLFTLKD